jgi:hypothetical protein
MCYSWIAREPATQPVRIAYAPAELVDSHKPGFCTAAAGS